MEQIVGLILGGAGIYCFWKMGKKMEKDLEEKEKERIKREGIKQQQQKKVRTPEEEALRNEKREEGKELVKTGLKYLALIAVKDFARGLDLGLKMGRRK